MKDSRNLKENAYQQIKNMIFYQKLVPGQKLIYRDLSDKLKMSKTPIIDALGRLDQEGFVELIPNIGYLVKSISVKDIEDFFEAREALEIQTIAVAIENQTEKNLKELEERIKRHRDYIVPVYDRKKLILDAKVHLQIAVMSGNKVILKLLSQIFEHLYFRHLVTMMHPARLTISSLEHLEILKLIKKRDYSKAKKMIRSHVRAARDNIISVHSPKGEEEIIDLTANY